MYHTAIFHHGTDCCDAGLMTVIGIRDRSHCDDGTFLKPLEFVFKHVETDLQVLGINNAEKASKGSLSVFVLITRPSTVLVRKL